MFGLVEAQFGLEAAQDHARQLVVRYQGCFYQCLQPPFNLFLVAHVGQGAVFGFSTPVPNRVREQQLERCDFRIRCWQIFRGFGEFSCRAAVRVWGSQISAPIFFGIIIFWSSLSIFTLSFWFESRVQPESGRRTHLNNGFQVFPLLHTFNWARISSKYSMSHPTWSLQPERHPLTRFRYPLCNFWN